MMNVNLPPVRQRRRAASSTTRKPRTYTGSLQSWALPPVWGNGYLIYSSEHGPSGRRVPAYY